MCMGNTSDNSQILQRQQQQQAQVDTGMEQLNRIFQGGMVGVNPLTSSAVMDPSKSYYDALGNNVTGDQAQNLFSQGQLFQGQQQQQGFTPDFYKNRENAYLNYANPQVYQQYGQQLGGLTKNLNNAGLQHSSVAQQGQSSLLQELNKQLQGQANTAIGQSQDLQRNVGNERATLTSQLQQSANPAQTSVGALQAASQFSAPPLLQPLGNLFQNWGSLYGANNLQQNYNNLMSNKNQNYSLLNVPQTEFAGLGQNGIFSSGRGY